jgi:hypothetical protein
MRWIMGVNAASEGLSKDTFLVNTVRFYKLQTNWSEYLTLEQERYLSELS